MKYSRSRTSRLNPLSYFILLSLCSSCDGLRFRRLPEERDLIFEVAATDPQKCCYKPNQAIEISLKITSEEENAQEKEFHILSATLADGTDVLSRLRHDPLKLHENIVRYTPQGAGVYDIQFRIGVPYEEEGVQESTCRVEAPKAVWDLRAEIKNTGELNVIIDGPEEWEGESWHIVEGPQWSEGLIGTISRKDYCVWEDTPLGRGDNKSQITLRQPTLNDPHLCFTLEGPDKEQKECQVDLTTLCVEQFKGGISEKEKKLATSLGEVNAYVERVDKFFTQDAQGSYQLPPDTATDPRVNRTKREELATLLGEIESYQRAYERNLQAFEAHLASLDQGQTNANVHIFRHAHKRLKDAIASLKSAQVQLGCQSTSSHEAFFKKFSEGKQKETDILLEDPRLDPNARVRINNGKETLLQTARRTGNEVAVRTLLAKGADPNAKAYISFELTATDPPECYYKKNQEIEIPLRLTSPAQAAQEETFHILSATLDNKTDVLAHVTPIQLRLQNNIVRYTPQSSGEHNIRLRIGVPYEEEGAQEVMCRVAVPAAAWSVQGVAKDTGALTVEIRGVPEEWVNESWRIVGELQWSEGLIGTISLANNAIWEDTPLQKGQNQSQITLTRPNLNDPHLCFTLQGPDGVDKPCRVDLTPLCVEQLKGDMSEQEQILATCLGTVNAYVQRVDEHFTQDAQGSYQLPPDTATDPRVNRTKREELATLLGEIESYQRAYERNLQAFEAHLASLDQGQTNANVHIFRHAHQRLKDTIASLKSAQVQLGCKCTSAHEVLFKKFLEGKQAEIEILLEDPRLNLNARGRINNEKETLLQTAQRTGNEVAARKLLEKRADPNAKAYISFEITATDPPECYYKKNQEIEIPLRLTSSEQTAQEETFHILSATLSNGTDVLAHITPTQLRLQNNIVRYRPQAPGEHNIRLLIGVPYEEKGVQKAMCRVAVPAAVWSVRAKATDTEKLTITIEGPEEWATESWRIVGNPQWSEGLTGTIFLADNSIWEDTPLQRGDNQSQITLIEPTFNDPHLSFTVEGPDKVAQTYRVDLTQLCVEQLKGDMSEQERILATRLGEVNAYVQQVDEHFTQDAQRSYQLPPETATDPRVNNTIREELTTLLGEIENYQRIYKQNFQVFEAHLESLAQGQTNTNVHRFRHAHKRLKDAISSLKSAQVQLECRCTSAHEALFKKLHEGKQQDTEILLEDPKLNPNAKCRINNGEETLLHAAARMDNEVAVKKLLEKGADVNAERSTDEATPLYLAITRGHENVAIILLEAEDIDPNARCCINEDEETDSSEYDEEQETLLHAAARMGNEVTVRKLLEKGADVNAERSTDEATPLYLAITRGHENVAIILLEAEDIDPNARCCINDEEQETSLHAAARMGNEVTVRKLLEKGADVNVERSTDEATPLYLAIDRDHESIVIVLLAVEGIDVNAKCRINEDDDDEEETLLHAAARMGNEVAVIILLEKGADVNEVSTDYLTVMPKYALEGDSLTTEDASQASEAGSADLREIWNQEVEVEEGDTPLHLAIDRGHEGVVRILLEARNINVNARSRDGATPLHAAAGKNNPEVVKLLLNAGAEVNNRYGKMSSLSRAPNYEHLSSLLNEIHSSEYDISPLHIATANGNLEIITLLIDSGAHRNAKYVHGSTVSPLHLAAAQGYVAAVQLLLERGARINQLASRWTPLHVAVWMNQIDVAKVLIDRGAKINPVTHTKNHWSKTPYELAKTTEMRNLLQASGGRRLSLIEKVFPSLLAPG